MQRGSRCNEDQEYRSVYNQENDKILCGSKMSLTRGIERPFRCLDITSCIGYVDYEYGDLLKDVNQTVTIYFSTPPTPLQMFRI